jgi:hypothetical protein
MVALRGAAGFVVTEPGQLLIEGLDGGFLLAQDFLDQLVTLAFDGFLLGEKLFDVVLGGWFPPGVLRLRALGPCRL